MMLGGFSKVYFKLFLVLCFLDVSYCCCKVDCCKGKTNTSKKTHDKSTSKSNKSTSGNPGDPIGKTPTGHDNTDYNDKKLSDIVCPMYYKKVVSENELNASKFNIIYGLSIWALNLNEEWPKVKKLFDDGKLVLYVYQTTTGPQYRLFGYIEDIKNIDTCTLFTLGGELYEKKGVKKLTNKIVAITMYAPTGSFVAMLLDDPSLTTNSVFPDK